MLRSVQAFCRQRLGARLVLVSQIGGGQRGQADRRGGSLAKKALISAAPAALLNSASSARWLSSRAIGPGRVGIEEGANLRTPCRSRHGRDTSRPACGRRDQRSCRARARASASRPPDAAAMASRRLAPSASPSARGRAPGRWPHRSGRHARSPRPSVVRRRAARGRCRRRLRRRLRRRQRRWLGLGRLGADGGEPWAAAGPARSAWPDVARASRRMRADGLGKRSHHVHSDDRVSSGFPALFTGSRARFTHPDRSQALRTEAILLCR